MNVSKNPEDEIKALEACSQGNQVSPKNQGYWQKKTLKDVQISLQHKG